MMADCPRQRSACFCFDGLGKKRPLRLLVLETDVIGLGFARADGLDKNSGGALGIG